MNNQYNFLRTNENGEYIGVNIPAIKRWIEETTPFHADLENYGFVHIRARIEYIEALGEVVE